MSESVENTNSAENVEAHASTNSNVDNSQEVVDNNSSQPADQGGEVQMKPNNAADVKPDSMNEHYVQDEDLLGDLRTEAPEKDTHKPLLSEKRNSLEDFFKDDEEKPKESVEEKPTEKKETAEKEEISEKEEPKEESSHEKPEETEQKSVLESVSEGKDQNTESEEKPVEEKPVEEKPPNKIKDRLLKSFPDREYASDDEAYDHAIDHIDQLEDFKTKNIKANEDLIKVFTENEDLLEVIRDVVSGAPFVVALARHVDLNGIEPLEGEPDYDEWKKAATERSKKAQERQDRIKVLEDNKVASENQIKAFIKSQNLSDEEADKFLKDVDDMLTPLANGMVGEQFLSKMYTALNHDKTVEAEKEAARIKAKNEKIVAHRQKETDPKGDTLPHISSQGTPPEETTTKTAEDALASIMDEAGSRERSVYGERK